MGTTDVCTVWSMNSHCLNYTKLIIASIANLCRAIIMIIMCVDENVHEFLIYNRRVDDIHTDI